MKAHLTRPDVFEAPPELMVYELERRLWRDFGVAQPPVELWPHAKLTAWTVIMQVETEIANERPAGGGTAHGPQPARKPIDQAALRRIRAQAKPPPMPPRPAPA